MNISINPATHVITILKSELGGTFPNHQLNVNTFREALKAWEESVDGIWQPDTHIHNTQVLLGGVTYARVVEIIAPYTITFEDDQYSVSLVGANNNIADRLNLNQVSIRSANSAGLITVTSGSGLSAEQNTQLMKTLTVAKFLGLK